MKQLKVAGNWAYVKRDHVAFRCRDVSGCDAAEKQLLRVPAAVFGPPCATGLVKGLDCVSVLLAPPLGCSAPLPCLTGDPLSSQTHWPILLPLSAFLTISPSFLRLHPNTLCLVPHLKEEENFDVEPLFECFPFWLVIIQKSLFHSFTFYPISRMF